MAINTEQIQQTISKYGWDINENELYNKLGRKVVTIKTNGSKYSFYDMSGKKLMSGRGKMNESIEKLLKEYYYAKEDKDTSQKETKIETSIKNKEMIQEQKNPLIGDEFFSQNPTKVLGEMTIAKGRFGSDFVKVKGSIDSLQKIELIPTLKEYKKETSSLPVSVETKQEAIADTFENKKKQTFEKEVVKRVVKKVKTTPKGEFSASDQEVYSIRETAEMYNKNISRDELEAYYFCNKNYDYTLMFDKYTNSQEQLLKKDLILPVFTSKEKFEFIYKYSYLSGNISKKISKLNEFKDSFVDRFGQEAFDKQIALLQSVKPKSKAFVGEDKIVLLPHSNFAKNQMISELRSNIDLNGQVSLMDAFISWLKKLEPDEFKLSNSSEIEHYYLKNEPIRKSENSSKEQKEREEKNATNTKQRSKEEGDLLFAKFLEQELLPEDQAKITYLWNEKYNSLVEPDLSKIPVGFRISKTFKDNKPFLLNNAQRQATAFMIEKKSGLLAYGVGVGKTASAIASCSQSIELGIASKCLFVVPTNTYFKWIGELQGYTDKETGKFLHGLLPHLPPVVGLYNLNSQIVRNEVKEYSAEEEKELKSIETVIETIKSMDENTDFNNTNIQNKILKIYPKSNFTGLIERYNQIKSSLSEQEKSKIQSFKKMILRYFRDTLTHSIYDLGKVKSFPNGTIFVTTEKGIEKLGVRDSAFLVSKLYSILSQGEQSGGQDREKEKAKLQIRIEETVSNMIGKSKLYLEDFDFDWVCFDESHLYKKTFTFVRGSIVSDEERSSDRKKYNREKSKDNREKSKYELHSGKPSSRALSAFAISHYIQEKNNNRNVLHLTATPFTNSPLEIYSMLSLTNHKQLEELGVDNMVDFFDTFMKINWEIKYTAKKEVTKNIVLLGFNNLPQMRQIIYNIIDKKELGLDLKKPNKIVLPNFESGITTMLPMTREQEEIMKDIKKFILGDIEYAQICQTALEEELSEIDYESMTDEQLITIWEDLTDKEWEKDFELSEADRQKLESQILNLKKSVIFNEADLTKTENEGAKILQALSAMRQVTLSPYTWECKRKSITPTYKQYIESSPKLKYVMGCVKSVIDHHKSKGQTPSGQVIYMNAGVNFFPLIKEWCVKEIGLSQTQVGFVHGKMSKGAKENVKKEFLRGDILVLIGSLTISIGIDLQNNSTVLYNCYYDWNPTDAQQLEGRIWRQGNKYANIRVVYPMCYNSADPILFQYLLEKTSRINEIWNRDGMTSELDLRDFDPKKLQKDLITDPQEKAEWEILEEIDKVQGQIIYYENRVKSIENAIYAINELEEQTPKVLDFVNSLAKTRAEIKKQEAIEAHKEKKSKIIDEAGDDEEKLTKDLAKLKKTAYDHNADPDKRYEPKTLTKEQEEELYNEAKKIHDWLNDLTYHDVGKKTTQEIFDKRWDWQKLLQSFRGNYKDYKQLQNKVLIPLGIDIKVSNPIDEINKKLAILRTEEEKIEKSKLDRIAKYKKEQSENSKKIGTIEDRIREFSKMNYLLDSFMPEIIVEEAEEIQLKNKVNKKLAEDFEVLEKKEAVRKETQSEMVSERDNKINGLSARIETIKEMIEDTKDKKKKQGLEARLETIEEMIEDLKNSKFEFEKGGKIEDSCGCGCSIFEHGGVVYKIDDRKPDVIEDSENSVV